MPIQLGVLGNKVLNTLVVALVIVYVIHAVANPAPVEKFSFPGQPKRSSAIEIKGESLSLRRFH